MQNAKIAYCNFAIAHCNIAHCNIAHSNCTVQYAKFAYTRMLCKILHIGIKYMLYAYDFFNSYQSYRSALGRINQHRRNRVRATQIFSDKLLEIFKGAFAFLKSEDSG